MKSLVMKSIYAGLGMLGSGKESVEQLGRKLAKRADLSAQDGEKIARELRARSQKALKVVQKTLNSEVDKAVHALNQAAKQLGPATRKSKAGRGRSKRKSGPRRASRAARG